MEATKNSIGQVMHPRSPQSLLRGARISILHGITARTAKLWLFMSCRARCEAMAHSSNQLAGWEKTSPPSMQCLSHTIDKPNTSYTTDLIIQGFSMFIHAGRLQRHLRKENVSLVNAMFHELGLRMSHRSGKFGSARELHPLRSL